LKDKNQYGNNALMCALIGNLEDFFLKNFY